MKDTPTEYTLLTAESIRENFDIDIDTNGLIPYIQFFKKIKGDVIMFYKIGEEDWKTRLTPLKELPYAEIEIIPKELTTKQVSEITGYHQDYIKQLCQQGKLKCTKFGRQWSIPKSELKKLRRV